MLRLALRGALKLVVSTVEVGCVNFIVLNKGSLCVSLPEAGFPKILLEGVCWGAFGVAAACGGGAFPKRPPPC